MTESRLKNSSRNILWGVINKIITLFLPFLTRTLTLYLLGANYLGIGTLFSSVLSFLSLTELGIGSAIVYSMYKPIAEGDIGQICGLLNYYRKLYRYVGITMLAIGTILVPFIPYLIHGDAPQGLNIYLLYYIYLVNAVISYFFSGYRSSLLSAHQREDVSTKILTLINILIQFGQIFALCLTKNFYVYAIVPIAGTLTVNGFYSIMTKRMFPEITPRGDIAEETKHEIKIKLSGLIGTKLNSVVVHSADTIIISAFLGLVMTAQYGNYYMIFNAVCGFLIVFYSSITASIGNKLVTDELETNYLFFRRLSFFNSWVICFCSTCFLCLYEPFMELWVGKDLALGQPFTVLMAVYFFIYQIQKPVLTFKDAAGLWNQDKLRPYVSMLVNVISNLILVQVIGIYGIVVSTILAFMISLPWANYILYKHLFKKKSGRNLLVFGWNFICTAIISAVTYFACSFCPEGILGLLLRLVICCILPNALLLLLNCRNEHFCYWKEFVLRILRREKSS